MVGYRRYWDVASKSFKADTELSEVHGSSSNDDDTVEWFTSYNSAKFSADRHNVMVDLKQIFVKECKDCHTSFILESDENNWFIAQGMKPPVRCYTCRKKRRTAVN